MPEIKHHFFSGKMNKDLDERLVPNGEYIDAMNIQVSTSGGSDSGTVRNIMGNELVSDAAFSNATCIGSISDEPTKTIYYFLATTASGKSGIIEYNTSNKVTLPVLIDNVNEVLEFSTAMLITGINIIDGMLFWTDNNSEPKKINISRSKEGSNNFDSNTTFINSETSGNVTLKKEHITVIKRSPLSSPLVALESHRDPANTYTGVVTITDEPSSYNNSSLHTWNGSGVNEPYDFSTYKVGSTFTTFIDTDLNGDSGFTLDWAAGDTVYLKAFEEGVAPTVPIVNPNIKAVVQSKHLRRTDEVAEYLRNTNFSVPDTQGDEPSSWTFSDSGITYDYFSQNISVKDCEDYAQLGLYSATDTAIAVDDTYNFEFELAAPVDSTRLMKGKAALFVVIEHPSDSSKSYSWNTPYQSIGGLYSETIKLTAAEANVHDNNSWTWREQKPFLRFKSDTPDLVDVGQITTLDGQSSSIATSLHASGDAWEKVSKNKISFQAQYLDGTTSDSHSDEYVIAYNAADDDYETEQYHTITTRITAFKNDAADDDGNTVTPFEGWIGVRLDGNPISYTTERLKFLRVYTYMTRAAWEGVDDWSENTYAARTTSYAAQVLDNYTGSQLAKTEISKSVWVGGSPAAQLDFEVVNTAGNDVDTSSLKCKIEATVKSQDDSIDLVVNSISLEDASALNARVKLKITSINGVPPAVAVGETELKYVVDREDSSDKLFEFKFPRFATRYKYQDGEYSAFSSFSQPAFLPGTFDYHPKKGYNLGMRNRLKKATIKNLGSNIPAGVVSIDILYKEDGATTVYIVDTVKSDEWSNDYEITRQSINGVTPSNQMLRPWDNVPKKALAQDVVGGRITYANYLHQHDLRTAGNKQYVPNIDFNFMSEDVGPNTARSVKSLREYQLGVVFVDEHGRETPVLSNKDISSRLGKLDASKSNKVSVSFGDSKYADNMKYFKFFIKETSGEYYNMAMDRYWDGGDGHAWISFSSSDRNKIDIDSFLVLKKGVETHVAVQDDARYKVISIANEAPDFIKTKKLLVESKQHIYGVGGGSGDLFANTNDNSPLSGKTSFQLRYEPFKNSSGSELHSIKDTLYVEFTDLSSTRVSNRYRVASLTTDFKGFNDTGVGIETAVYGFTLDEVLGEDVDFIANSTSIKDGTRVKIYRYTVENSPEFDGRFFVKVINDTTFANNINANTITSENYKVVASKKLYYMGGTHNAIHDGSITGQVDGIYADGFGRFAPYFRNYKYAAGDYLVGGTDAGQYKFGAIGDGNWKTEYDFTVGENAYDDTTTRAADDQSVDDSVWFIDEGDFKGTGVSGFDLNWAFVKGDNGSQGGIGENSSGGYWTMNLAIGGIYSSHEPTVGDSDNAGFFDIGRAGGNPNYTDGATTALVSQLNPAKLFRFKEDPNNTIYEIQPGVEYEQCLRYSQGNGSGSTYPPDWEGNGVDTYQHSRLSPNFTRNWKIRSANTSSANSHDVTWEPTNNGTLGPIPGGLVLTIDHSATLGTISGATIEVKVDSLQASDASGNKHDITVGMILTSHSGGGASDTFDASDANDDYLVVWDISKSGNIYTLGLTGYTQTLTATSGALAHNILANKPTASAELTFKQPAMNGYSQNSVNRINTFDPNNLGTSITAPGLYAVGYTIEFIESIEEPSRIPTNPAIWETEPKEGVDLDIYYEASDLMPVEWSAETLSMVVPIGATATKVGDSSILGGVTVTGITDVGVVTLSESVLTTSNFVEEGSELRITRADGSSVDLTITSVGTVTNNRSDTFTVNTGLYGNKTTYNLNWSNCYSFGNGVESNRVGDNFNLPYVATGVKASTTLDTEYKEERRKYGLIFSGIYNSTSGVNNLNQFIQAEQITKDINPLYGSIQKLHQKDSDLIVLCENKVLRMLSNKDAIYNADGNPQLIANNNVLGQAIPFSGEFGISKNPESFIAESFRSYFTDKSRGAVMRLSKDGLTPISSAGMKAWFKDNLKLNDTLIGSYDKNKDEYNITLKETKDTVSFREDVKGWSSFKSFGTMSNGVSCDNDYYTFRGSAMWKHHSDQVNMGSFYGEETECGLSFVVNQEPNVIKNFNTLSYEGTQAASGGGGSELSGEVDGWVVQSIQTNQQSGTLLDFIEKEGKWFGYISGDESLVEDDLGSFHVKGIGGASSIDGDTITYSFPITSGLVVGDKIQAGGRSNVVVDKVEGIYPVNDIALTSGKYFWFNQEKMEISRFNGEAYKSGVVVDMYKDTTSGDVISSELVTVRLFKNDGLLTQDDANGLPLAYGRLDIGSGYGDWVVEDVLFGDKVSSNLGVVKAISANRKVVTLEEDIYSNQANIVSIPYIIDTESSLPSGKYFWFEQRDMEVSRFGGDSYNSGKVVTITRERGGLLVDIEVKLFKDDGQYAIEDEATGIRYAYGRRNFSSYKNQWNTTDIVYGDTSTVEVDVNRVPVYTYYKKNQYIENSGLIGYYATVNLENKSTVPAELFSFGSNITKSSQ